jgi:hypothetical protein
MSSSPLYELDSMTLILLANFFYLQKYAFTALTNL